jgi:dephospho-CoA kinase
MNMRIVGLTGGIGSGKGLVAQIFGHLGISVFNADSESRQILSSDLQVRHQLIQWFGPEIYTDAGPDRARLAAIIFSNAEWLDKVNRLVHPRVFERFSSWCATFRNEPYIIHEAAILFESGFYRQMDSTILVTAPEIIRIDRIRKRDKTTEEEVRKRMQNQWPDEKKVPLADFIIQNDGESPLIPEILEIHKKLITKR